MAQVFDSSKPAGYISANGSATAPDGYLLCDGSSVLRVTYPRLFAAIGTAYGSADASHFNLPDLRGKFVRGVNAGASADPDASSRTASASGGNTGNAVGSTQGHAFQTHNHAPSAANFLINQTSAGNYTLGAGGLASASTATANAQASGGTSQPTGNETRPVNVYVTYVIKF